ncbi:hypothetical protein [Pseudoroseomonas ludipueritiae]
MLKRPLLAIAMLASGLGAGTGLAANTPPMSRQDSVEQVVGAGQTASLCLTRDSSVTVSAVRCRRTEGVGDSSPGRAGAPQSVEAAPPDDAPAPQAPGGAAGPGGAGGGAAPGAAPGGAAEDMTKTWTCPSGTPCFGDGGFLPGTRQPLLDPSRARFCVRYLNAGQASHTVRADFVFSYPAR